MKGAGLALADAASDVKSEEGGLTLPVPGSSFQLKGNEMEKTTFGERNTMEALKI